MKQKLLMLFTWLLPFLTVHAQEDIELLGRVVHSQTKEPIIGLTVILEHQKRMSSTDEQGQFIFINLQPGPERLLVKSAKIQTKTIEIEIPQEGSLQLKDIEVLSAGFNDISGLIGVISEQMADEESESATQGISSTVILSNDIYLNKVGYQLSPFRFRTRGYANYQEQKFINGVIFNDQLRGVFNFAAVGALNDLTRNGDYINYNKGGSFTFGSIGGSENINMRASSYARGGKVTVSYTNRNYYARTIASYSTGLQDNGFAFTAALGGRYAHEGNIEGTFYNNLAYSLSVEKQWKSGEHSLSLVSFGSPVERGQQGSSFQEAYDLVGSNLYNPNWGYQNGKKRNSRVVHAYDPTAILSHIWKINPYSSLTTGLAVHYGQYGNTSLNWYNGYDPRPDYYRYMPSYQTSADDRELYTKLWKDRNPAVTQINWDQLYDVNKLSTRVGDGSAIYMVEERKSNLMEYSFNSTFNSLMKNNFKITAGIGARSSQSNQFKIVDDLLGADYVLDIDKFAERDFPGDQQVIQNDMRNPNRKALKGDKFGYDFNINIQSANAWFLNEYSGNQLDVYYGARITYTDFQREGKLKNGRYPLSSLGRGELHSFVDYAIKGGATYKFNGRHYLSTNLSYQTEAPLPNNAYISPRISDRSISDMESGKIFSADLNYVFSLPSLSGRVSAFQTNFMDQIDRVSYYHDAERTFINHMLTGMNQVNRGFELGATYKLDNNWSFDAIGTWAEYYYSNNPNGMISSENGKIEGIKEQVYLKDYYVGSTPQMAGSLGVRYFYNFWFFGANINGFDRNYIDIAPFRRLASNYATVNPNDPSQLEAYEFLTHQEKYPGGYTIDLSVGKIFYLKDKKSVNFNLSVNNILNDKNIRTGGFEQGRMDLTSPKKFASKYYYMQGVNCFLNASYRF